MQRSQQRCLRTLLIHGASTDYHLPQFRLIDQCGIPWRRSPLTRVHLLYVIHEIETYRPCRARIKCCKNAWLPVSGDLLGMVETSVAQQVNRQITSLRNAAILRRNRWLPNPILQPPYRLIMALFDLFADRVLISLCGARALRPCESRCAANCSLNESSPIHVICREFLFRLSVKIDFDCSLQQEKKGRVSSFAELTEA